MRQRPAFARRVPSPILARARRRRCLRRSSAASTAIAIDGPVASGKSSVGSRVAAALHWPFLDTGTMYRAITWLALRRGIDPANPNALGDLAAGASLRVLPPPAQGNEYATVIIDGNDATPFLRTPEVERAVSAVSAVPAVRRRMVELQREIARDQPLVMAGRDIGTVVLPDARLKVYLDATAATRAERRTAELARRGTARAYEVVLAETIERDRLDSGREDSPLRPASDAVHIATDGVAEVEVVDQILALVRRTLGVEV